MRLGRSATLPSSFFGPTLLAISFLGGLLLAYPAAASTPPIEATALRSAAQDSRLDFSLARWLDRRAAGSSAAELGAEAARTQPEAVTDLQQISVFISGTVDPGALAALGVQVQTQAGDVLTAEMPLESLPAVLALPGVQRIDAAKRLEPQLNVSATETDAVDLWGSTPPVYSGLSGRGVVVGIIDTGLDLTHADFRTSANKTRVKYLWDQTASGTPPTGFVYGAEYTEAQINAGGVTQTDDNGHGTHIAGIAAGNGRATGNGYAAYRYVGIAPEADLIIVKMRNGDADVVNAVNYIFTRAAGMGRSAVALIAWGHHYGGHDGSYSMDQALSALTGPGKLIVAAAGNYAGKPIHSRVNLAGDGETTTTTFSIPTYTPLNGISEVVQIEGWHDATAAFDVKLTSPNGFTTNWITPNATSGTVRSSDGSLRVSNAQVTSVKGGKQVVISAFDSGDSIAPRPGTWKIDVRRRAGATTGVFDAWINGEVLGPGAATPVAFTSNIDLGCLVSTPASADSVIAVGAYTTKTQWTNSYGKPSFYTSYPPMWSIASFSSPGPRRDGLQRPDLCAPGQGVVSALSAPVAPYIGNIFTVEDGVHWITYGTSMAAAHVAGGLALLLQSNPNLTPATARALLVSQARADTYTGAVPNTVWGRGKFDLIAAALAVGDGLAARFALAPAYPNPAHGTVSFAFALAAGDLAAGSTRVQLRIIDIRGREVASVAGSPTEGPQHLAWNGLTADGRRAPAGVYFAHLEVGTAEAVRKFVHLD
jgi:minor extracellular serine protease Vpr